jgi:hypothetical protein
MILGPPDYENLSFNQFLVKTWPENKGNLALNLTLKVFKTPNMFLICSHIAFWNILNGLFVNENRLFI